MSELIRKWDAIYAVEGVDWYHINERGELVKGANSKDHEPLYKAKDIYEALENVKPIQPTQTNCEYCHTDRDGYALPLEKNCHAYISFGMHGWVIELKAKGWRGEAKIKYCPICGRRLTDGTD